MKCIPRPPFPTKTATISTAEQAEINTWEAPGALEYRALDISPEVPEGFAAKATVCSHRGFIGMWEFCQEYADTVFFGDVEVKQQTQTSFCC